MSDLPENHITCRTCRGKGEVLMTTHAVGNGCVNDTWDICHTCNGTGTRPLPDPQRDPVHGALINRMSDATRAFLRDGDLTAAPAFTAAMQALAQYGLPTAYIQSVIKSAYLDKPKRGGYAPERHMITDRELEALR